MARELSSEDLQRAKTRMIADAVYAQDSQVSLARWYGAQVLVGSHPAHAVPQVFLAP